jgi:glucose-1-phosphate cytidylyltransferase
MKVVLAGGLGTRIAEETSARPKPMVEIGGRPILWHIMKIYSRYGFNDFVICPGYKGYMIKEYFANYFLHMSDVTFRLVENRMEVRAYVHRGFWHPMDSLRDRTFLEEEWATNRAKWRI